MVKCFMTRVANALHGRQMKLGTRRRRAPVALDPLTLLPPASASVTLVTTLLRSRARSSRQQ